MTNLARKSSQETPPSVASAEPPETSGQFSLNLTASMLYGEASLNAPTIEIISKEGMDKAENTEKHIRSN